MPNYFVNDSQYAVYVDKNPAKHNCRLYGTDPWEGQNGSSIFLLHPPTIWN